MDWLSIISLFFSLRLISSYYWNHIPKNHSRICTLLFRSWFCLWTFSSKRTLEEAFILHVQLEMDIFGFRTPWVWISLDAEVPLEGSLFFGEPSVSAVAAFAFPSVVPRKEAEAVLLLLLMVHCFFWLPDIICFPVKNKKKRCIAWEHYYFQPSVPHHFYFQQNGFQACILEVVTDTNIVVTATQLYCNKTLTKHDRNNQRYFIKLSCYSKQYIFTLRGGVEGVKAFLIQTYDIWLSLVSYSLDREILALLYLVRIKTMGPGVAVRRAKVQAFQGLHSVAAAS